MIFLFLLIIFDIIMVFVLFRLKRYEKDILSIELLPNVSLGTFVVIPLIFSVLFFIVKVAKGGD